MSTLLALVAGLALGLAVYMAIVFRPRKSLYGFTPGKDPSARYRRYSNGWFDAWADKFSRSGGQLAHPKVPGTLMIAVPILLGILGAAASGFIGALPLVAVVAVVVPWLFLKGQSEQRARAIDSQLVPFLDAVSKGLVGGTLEQAVRYSASRVGPPLSHELAIVMSEVDSGRPLADALQDMASRTSSRSLTITCATLDMASSSGSPALTTNLSEITGVVVAVQGLDRQVKARTLITRWAGRITIGVVAVFTVGSILIAPDAWFTPWGIPALAVLIGSLFGLRKLFGGIQKRIMEVSP